MKIGRLNEDPHLEMLPQSSLENQFEKEIF
jgi:hypothetical protein